VSTCANFVANCSFGAEGVKWTTDQCISLAIIIGLVDCGVAADTDVESE